MTSKIPDDLLSAFLDREVTPDEEALVRKHLQKSAQARQEFQDYQRLGQLLHELPRRTVPTEFAAAVMQQAERETLIPLEASATLPSDSRSGRPFRRAWIVSLVGLAAAVVFVVVNLPARKDAAWKEDAVVVRDEAFAPRATQAESRLEKAASLESSPSIPPARKLDVDSKMVVAKADGHFRAKRASALARPAAPPLNVAAAAPLADKSRMVFPAELKAAREGDVVEALESVGDQVAVVRLTLVNRTASVGGLQNLLVRDASRPVRGEEKEKLMRERFAERKASVVVDSKTVSNGPGELICVFVEGSREELVGVLKEVQNQSQVQRAQLTNAISPAKLAEYAQRPVATARAQALSLPHAAVDKITGVASAFSKTVSSRTMSSKRASTRTASPGMGGMGTGLGGQAAVPQSANDLMDLVQSATGDARQKQAVPAEQSAPALQNQAAALKGKQLVAGTTQRSYQVFFVLDDQSVTESLAKPEAKPEAAPETKSHVRPRTPVRAHKPMRKRHDQGK